MKCVKKLTFRTLVLRPLTLLRRRTNVRNVSFLTHFMVFKLPIFYNCFLRNTHAVHTSQILVFTHTYSKTCSNTTRTTDALGIFCHASGGCLLLDLIIVLLFV